MVNELDDRVLYEVSTQCNSSQGVLTDDDPQTTCGACTGNDVVVPGWECTENEFRRKRFGPSCPCENEPVPVESDNPPELGECALFINHCVNEIGDGEECCVVVAI